MLIPGKNDRQFLKMECKICLYVNKIAEVWVMDRGVKHKELVPVSVIAEYCPKCGKKLATPEKGGKESAGYMELKNPTFY